jgi:hypothetical protein
VEAKGIIGGEVGRGEDFEIIGQNDYSSTVISAETLLDDSSFLAAGVRNNRYSPYAGICFDPFINGNPGGSAANQYPGLSRYYTSSAGGNYIHRVAISKFNIGIMNSPSGDPNMLGGDNLYMQDCYFTHCRIGFASGQPQTKSNAFISRDHASWKIAGPKEGEPEGIEVEYSQSYSRFEFDAPYTNRQAIESFRAFLSGSNTRWVEPSANEWILDLDQLRKPFPQLSSLNWVRGKIPVELRVETQETFGSRSLRETLELSGAPKDPFARPTQYTYESKVFFSVSREAAENFGVFMEVPTEVRESIRRFRLDFPDPDKTCFKPI